LPTFLKGEHPLAFRVAEMLANQAGSNHPDQYKKNSPFVPRKAGEHGCLPLV